MCEITRKVVHGFGISPDLPLIYLAVESRNKEVVELLLKKGVKVDEKDKKKRTALMRAAEKKGCVQIVQLLLGYDTDVYAVDTDGWNVLQLATMSGDKDTVILLFEKVGGKVRNKDGKTPLHLAALNNHSEIVEFFLEKGADINARDEDKRTPLIIAVQNRCIGSAKVLIKYTLLKNQEAEKTGYLEGELSEYWDQCLSEIEKMKEEKIHGDVTFYDILVSKGSKLASYMRNENIAKKLGDDTYKEEFPIYAHEIENRYLVGRKRIENKLHFSNEGRSEIGNTAKQEIKKPMTKDNKEVSNFDDCKQIRHCLERRADVNAKLSDGLTLLHSAVKKGNRDVAELLLDNGADVNAAIEEGCTPLHMAMVKGNKNVVELLLDRGAEVDAAIEKGYTPLCLAVVKGYKNIVKLLLNRGAEVDAKDKKGHTPSNLIVLLWL
ncbi:ankyrin repeat domain-containing protein [Wolbachia endosymbiont (group A) of Agelastica alni]|uniref:ankyrin repeat domain-containing protein n=1 Tax=Wolbachia endosymbiont (group A) of Agelastica alni TaxID=3066130 RepID=UPI0031331DA2